MGMRRGLRFVFANILIVTYYLNLGSILYDVHYMHLYTQTYIHNTCANYRDLGRTSGETVFDEQCILIKSTRLSP